MCVVGVIPFGMHQSLPILNSAVFSCAPATEMRKSFSSLIMPNGISALCNWQPEQALDLIFANASLQWLPDHYELFPHLVSLLSPLGVLAVQMPDNWLEPTHVLMREVAWEQNYPDRGREPLAGVHAYYDILSEAGCEVDIWRTTYYHQMPSHQAIIDWVTATGLRPWLQDLTESEQQHFLTRYHQMLEEQYPLQENGQILLAFPRLFIVARRTE